MPSTFFQTPGYRATLTPEGRTIVQIPVSVTDDSAPGTVPSGPTGTRLVSAEYTIRQDGGRDYVYTYESSGTTADAQIQINGQAAQEPIETHPKFNGEQNAGTVNDADLAAIKASLSDGTSPSFTGTGNDLTAAQNLYSLMLKGVTHYYTASGVTYSETFDESLKPNLAELCSVNKPPSSAPTLSKGANWLQIGLRAQKIYQPNTQTSFWRVTREWLASGPRGWNADFEIYN